MSAFQTADDLFSGFAFRLPSLDVFDGWLVRAHAGGGDTPQSVVGLAVASAVETSVDGTIVLWMDTPVLLERTDDHGTVATDIHGLSPRVRGNLESEYRH